MSENRVNRFPLSDRLSFLWLLIGFILVVFTYGMYRNPLAGWLAPLFLIRFLRTKKVGAGYLWLALALVVANIISWWNTSFELPAVGRIIFGLVVGFIYTIPLLLDRVLVGRFRGFVATLVFPVVHAGYEFLTIWPNPLSAFGSIANAQFSSVYLTQLMSITGMWGVTFLTSWFASTVNWIWEEGVAWQRIRRGVAVYTSVLGIVLIYGMVRLTVFVPEASTVRIHGVVETNYTREEWAEDIAPLSATDPEAFRAIVTPGFERYLQATIREAQAGAQIVVWPEVAVEGYREDVDALLERAREIARQEDIYLAMGIGVVSADPAMDFTEENKLVIVDPQGEVVVDQHKYGCMALNMYDFEIQIVDTPHGKLAGVLCCDLEYPYVVRQVSQKGVDILLVPSFEPAKGVIRAHAQMTPFRAVENGVSIFRPTIQGISLAIDPYGRVLGAMNHILVDEPVFVAQVPNQRVFTIYSVIGDLFGWLAVVGFVVIVFWAVIQGRKARSEDSPRAEG